MSKSVKLTDEMIHFIKSAPEDKARPELMKEVNERFGITISKTTVYDVQTGKTHKDKYPELTREPKYRQVRISDHTRVKVTNEELNEALAPEGDDGEGNTEQAPTEEPQMVETVAEGTPVLDNMGAEIDDDHGNSENEIHEETRQEAV